MEIVAKVRAIRHGPPSVIFDPVDRRVIDHSPLVINEGSVPDYTRREGPDVVRKSTLQDFTGICPTELPPNQRGNVAYRNARPYSFVLSLNIPERACPVPSPELNECRAKLRLNVV